ncbi:MAG: DUF4292 domain-containing protein [Bacteroidales bacterium]|jgi:hypothetical protein|nr:DUF4292 domain-containing protein [Bacteroidales bacterium]
MNKFTLILTLILILFLQSCRSTKQVKTVEVTRDTEITETVEPPIKLRADFEWFATNFSGAANYDGNRYSISGQIRIQNGEQIWISVVMYGFIEGARLKVTRDSVFLWTHNQAGRPQNTTVHDFNFFKDVIGMDITFEMLQDILVGDFVYIDIPNTTYLYEFSAGNRLFVQIKEPVSVELRLTYSKTQLNVPQNMPFPFKPQ